MSKNRAERLVARMLEYAPESGFEMPEDDPGFRAKNAGPVKFGASDFLGKRGHDDLDGDHEEDLDEPKKPVVIPRFKWRPPNPPGP